MQMVCLLEAARAHAMVCNLVGTRQYQRRPVMETIQRQRNLSSYCGSVKVHGCSQWAVFTMSAGGRLSSINQKRPRLLKPVHA